MQELTVTGAVITIEEIRPLSFPVKKMKLYDLIKYIFSTIPGTDTALLVLITAAMTGIGFFTPVITTSSSLTSS